MFHSKVVYVPQPVHSIVTVRPGPTDHMGRATSFKLIRDGEELFTHSLAYISSWLRERGYKPVLGFGYWMKELANVRKAA